MIQSRFVHCILFCLFWQYSSWAQAKPRQNVILITLDGVRYHEIFQGVRKPGLVHEKRNSPIIPDITSIVHQDGFFFGDRTIGEPTMKISNKATLSQPGYLSILSGQYERVCRENDCPNVNHETVIDRLMDEGAQPKEVAVFSSWDVIGRCIESEEHRAIRSISFDPIEGLSESEAAPFDAIQADALLHKPPRWKGSRWDHYTFDMGLMYLKTYQPRFLYLAFIEPDEYGHKRDYPGYVQSLRDFNDRFAKLVDTLKSMGQYGEETSIVVTTDHGRGRGFLWNQHSKEWRDSRRIWSIVLPSKGIRERQQLAPTDQRRYFQDEVRPTVEFLLGLEPRAATTGRGVALIKKTNQINESTAQRSEYQEDFEY